MLTKKTWTGVLCSLRPASKKEKKGKLDHDFCLDDKRMEANIRNTQSNKRQKTEASSPTYMASTTQSSMENGRRAARESVRILEETRIVGRETMVQLDEQVIII